VIKSDLLSETIKNLPNNPGIYKYFNQDDEIIYIGKAKNLKNRVSSYFNKQQYENYKTKKLVENIFRIEFALVDTEMDALLLENLLIKQHKPKYNINLKDDKSYPFIKISKERFPKIYATRQHIKDGSDYFGPFASLKLMNTLLDLVKTLYPIRNCNLLLSEQNIKAQKYKICLEYQIGNCKGPCEGFQTEEAYMQSITAIKNILKGNISEVINHLKAEMQSASADMRFEEAHIYKQKIEQLHEYQSKSTVVSQSVHNVDIFSIADEENFAFVNFLRVMNGMIIQTQTLELRKKLNETKEELLLEAIGEIWNRYGNTTKEIVLPFSVELESTDKLIVTIPQAGDKKKLLDLSLKNVFYFKKEKLLQYEKLNPEIRVDRLMEQMQKDLRLPKQPRRIDCFDNSNFQGSFPVSAMVCFIDGKAAKNEYRHYKVKTVEGPNDFDTMKEVILRRYSRVIEEGIPYPDLIIVDGGKGQLSSAIESLQLLGLFGKIPIMGIAKRLEELYMPGDDIPLYIDKKSETLKVIQQLRDEAHRFGITHHRKLRDKNTLRTGLEDIENIGQVTAEKLLKHFKSVKKIKVATIEQLVGVIGKDKGHTVYNFYHKDI
jgi:excinuclease ABC subunit C